MGGAGSRSCGWGRDEGSYADEVAKAEGRRTNPHSKQNFTGRFGACVVGVQLIFTFCLFFTDYTFTAETVFASTTADSFYSSIALFLLVGFGYLRAFLKFYGMGAIGFTFLIFVVGVQWALLLEGWIRHSSAFLQLDMTGFLQSSIAVASALISFGALVGKISPLQILVFTILQLTSYFADKIAFLEAKDMQPFVDAGGGISINVFGAFFGLAASLAFGPAREWYDGDNRLTLHPEATLKGSYFSDILSLVGTAFLWIYSPTFVAASLPMGSAAQRVAVMNTFLALLGSTVAAVACSTIPGDRLQLDAVRFASLSGAVGISAVASFPVGPGGAVLIGAASGVVSCALCVRPLFSACYDTANIMAVNGVPGVLSGVVSIVLPTLMPVSTSTSWSNQLTGLLGTLLIASVSGAFTGLVLRLFPRPLPPFHDDTFWDTDHLNDRIQHPQTLPSAKLASARVASMVGQRA